ncbi:hypothetical protein T11_8009, partial [Trichinella zimbabwensis]
LKSAKNDFSENFREKRLFRKFSRKSPSEHPNRAQFALKTAKNDFTENFHENRPLSTQIMLNSP